MKIFSLALLTASAVKATKEIDLASTTVRADSEVGNRILSKARQLDGGDGEISWIAGYSIKFHSCVASQDYYGGYFADNGENAAQGYNGENYDANQVNNGNYNNGQEQYNNGQQQGGYNGYYNEAAQQRNAYNGMYEQRLVHFKLCPSDSCTMCSNGADYVVDMNDFIEAFLEAQKTATEYNCERVRSMCYCENAYNKNQCLSTCYKNANLGDSCFDYQQNSGFDLGEAAQCAKLELNGQYNTNNGDVDYYVGPYCSKNGRSILMGVFMEETCSYPAPKGTYEAMNYGEKLPYSSKSIVSHSCISCKEPTDQNEQNYWDQQDADQVADVCERLYEYSGKCEKNLNIWSYKDNSACAYISTLKQPLGIPTNVPAKVLAGIFGVATAILGGAAIFLYNKSKRTNVALAGGTAEAELA
mmetsp:Transcript_15213/g.31019  ORF Transcript_15213/g.31019 Transcript_15213/m.31019 type:complete len:415 (+) Transcript_15213:167-1411(+)